MRNVCHCADFISATLDFFLKQPPSQLSGPHFQLTHYHFKFPFMVGPSPRAQRVLRPRWACKDKVQSPKTIGRLIIALKSDDNWKKHERWQSYTGLLKDKADSCSPKKIFVVPMPMDVGGISLQGGYSVLSKHCQLRDSTWQDYYGYWQAYY